MKPTAYLRFVMRPGRTVDGGNGNSIVYAPERVLQQRWESAPIVSPQGESTVFGEWRDIPMVGTD